MKNVFGLRYIEYLQQMLIISVSFKFIQFILFYF